MKKLLLLSLFVISIITSLSGQEFDTYTYASTDYIEKSLDIPVVREIRGGTIIKVNYEGEWTAEEKGAFEYACKLWEEKLPTTLPIYLTVKFASLRGSYSKALSKISTETFKESYNRATSPEIKAFYFTEYGFNNIAQFLNFETGTIDDILYSSDASITYNSDKKDEFSFSLEATPTNKYDFVTVALRDIAKALGINLSITADPASGFASINRENLIKYDKLILDNIGTTDPYEVYKRITCGEFNLKAIDKNYKLYAPNPFEPGKSLCEFYPDPKLQETQLLSCDFGYGTVVRDLGDNFYDWFKRVLGWTSSAAVGPSTDAAAELPYSTDKVVSYNSNIELNYNSSPSRSPAYSPNNSISYSEISMDNNYMTVNDYCKKYDHYLKKDGTPASIKEGGWFVSFLKKDGSWDVVHQDRNTYLPLWFDTSEIDPNKVENYARTCDGYLRCRVSYFHSSYDRLYAKEYKDGFSKYVVVDYLPQKPKLEHVKTVAFTGNSTTADVKIAMRDLEGTERMYVEEWEEGESMPIIYEIDDFKKGYFIANIYKDSSTKFILQAINKNGTTYSNPITVKPINSIKFKFDPEIYGDFIKLKFKDEDGVIYEKYVAKDYQIHSLNSYITSTVKSGNLENTDVIDIGSLDKGLYVLNVKDEQNKTYSTKFQK